ncbi:unnamed protein product, partial [Adineta ricciae]
FYHIYYHLEAIKVVVDKNDFYVITANSSIDLYGHIYKDHFYPVDPTKNLIAWYGKCCNKDQFNFTIELLVGTQYILVVTTYNPYDTGPFLVTVFGSYPVRFERISE